MRQVLIALMLATTVAALAVAPASAATGECNGLQICVPIAGPWIVVPTGGSPRTTVQFVLACPRGYIVGGLDAELSVQQIDITFTGTLGSPVNPGVTTSTAVVFAATYVGGDRSGAVSARAHIGCIPATGGGGRVPTAASAVFPVGHPTVRRGRVVRLEPGATRVTQRCAAGERLISATHAVGFFRQQPPGAALMAGVSAVRTVANGRVAVVARATGSVATERAILQVTALCAGGR